MTPAGFIFQPLARQSVPHLPVPKKSELTDEDILNDLIFSGLPLLVSVCGKFSSNATRDARAVALTCHTPRSDLGSRTGVMVGVGFGV